LHLTTLAFYFTCTHSHASHGAGPAARSPSSIKEMLLEWCKVQCAGYEVVIYHYTEQLVISRLILSLGCIKPFRLRRVSTVNMFKVAASFNNERITTITSDF